MSFNLSELQAIFCNILDGESVYSDEFEAEGEIFTWGFWEDTLDREALEDGKYNAIAHLAAMLKADYYWDESLGDGDGERVFVLKGDQT
jgi:hypothetical protein